MYWGQGGRQEKHIVFVDLLHLSEGLWSRLSSQILSGRLPFSAFPSYPEIKAGLLGRRKLVWPPISSH